MMAKKINKNLNIKLIFAVTILSLIVIIGFASFLIIGRDTIYDSEDYQIVYLDGGLFYFCMIEDRNNEYIVCHDPYYIVQRQEIDENGDKTTNSYVTTPQEEEIFKPEGPLYIKKDMIVYIADVGEESQVQQYIDQKE